MTPFIFPTAVALFVFGSWVALVAVEPCSSQNTNPKFDCWTSIQFVGIFAGLGSILTGLVALLSRVLLHPHLPFDTRKPELLSAILSGSILVLLAYSVMHWEFDFGHIGYRFFGWLGVSFVVCSSSLLIVKHLTLGRRSS